MRKFFRRILLRPVLRLTERYSSRPDRNRIFTALSELLDCIRKGKVKKGLVIPFALETGRFIIFSDQHKGGGDGADDFQLCANAYCAALDHYAREGFHFIALGDCEELWENTVLSVSSAHKKVFEKEAQFLHKNAFIKIFGNHDLFWDNDPLAPLIAKNIYGQDLPIYEGVVLQTEVAGRKVELFCTHGHQGDAVSDGNWFSKFFVSKIWAPLQSYLQINPNTPAYDSNLKTIHNLLMYEWSTMQSGLILITGHTHQPVFESLTHMERLYRQLLFARKQGDAGLIASLEEEINKRKFKSTGISDTYLSMLPSYFNSGCCCFDHGGITGIEISEGVLRLVEWMMKGQKAEKKILEEVPLSELMQGFFAPGSADHN